MRRSSLKERLRLETEKLKANPEYQKDLRKLKKRLKSENLDIEQFANDRYVKAFTAKNNFYLKWELKDWICGKPVLHGLEVESDFIRKGRLLYIPSWVNRGDIRNYIPQLEKVIESKRLSWGTLKNNSPSLRAERNKKIRERHNVLRKKGIGYTKATEMMADEFFCSAKTVQRIICNSKSDK